MTIAIAAAMFFAGNIEKHVHSLSGAPVELAFAPCSHQDIRIFKQKALRSMLILLIKILSKHTLVLTCL